MTATTLIHGAVHDLLHQCRFEYAHFPEFVELAVVASGVGLLRSNLNLVSQISSFWDSTQWLTIPRPFLGDQALSYTWALKVWNLDNSAHDWADELPGDIKRGMQKSLKYLNKTNDSFFRLPTHGPGLGKTQDEWIALLSGDSVSGQLIALNHLAFNDPASEPEQSILIDALRSDRPEVVLHAIAAIDRMALTAENLSSELRVLVEDRNDEIKAKAILSLARIGAIDAPTAGVATKLLDSNVRFLRFAGVVALASLDSLPQPILPAVNRGFVSSLQSCDYEIMGLFAMAFHRWLPDPQSHFNELLTDDSPEYLEMALDALKNAREQFASID